MVARADQAQMPERTRQYSETTTQILESLPSRFANAIKLSDREHYIADIVENRNLNPAQLEAVLHEEGPMVVLACAGSGKTTVMKEHALITALRGTPASQILMLSFTNKAVQEMKDRVYYEMSKFARNRPVISTIHGLAGKILRRHAPIVGYRTDYEIVNDENKMTALKSALKAVPADYAMNMGSKSEDAVQALERQIASWKNELVSYTDPTIKNHPLQAAYQRYQLHLHRRNVLDCDDIIRLAVEILNRNENVRREWQKRYKKVIVDEFQDVNKAQFTLLRMITEKHNCLCVVGDDDQSIYGWRGAKVELIQNLHEIYEGIHRVTLEINYRSVQPILNLANRLMSNVKKRVDKTLTAFRSGGKDPRYIAYANNREQAEHIAQEIKHEVETIKGRKYSDYVIIVRNSKSMNQPISQMLKEKIPHEIWNTENTFLGEVRRNVLSLLSVVHSPESDDLGIMQLLESSQFSIPERDFDLLMTRIDSLHEPADEQDQTNITSLWEIICSEEERGHYSDSAQETFADLQEKVTTLCEMYANLDGKERMNVTALEAMRMLYPERTKGDWHTLTPEELERMRKIRGRITLNFANEDDFYDNSDDGDEFEKVVEEDDSTDWSYVTETLSSILADIRKWKPGVAGATFKAYLGWKDFQKKLAKLPPEPETVEQEQLGAVVITTIHRAKGLEWPIGYLIDMNENDLPGWRTIDSKDQDKMDEDTRLALVAVTRPKDEIRISSTKVRFHGKRKVDLMVSRFIEWMGLHRFEQDADSGQKHMF